MNTSPKISPRSTPLSSIADLVEDLKSCTTSLSSTAGTGTGNGTTGGATGATDGNTLRGPAKRKRSEDGIVRGGRFVVGGAVVTANPGIPSPGTGTTGKATAAKDGKVDYIRFRDVNWSK